MVYRRSRRKANVSPLTISNFIGDVRSTHRLQVLTNGCIRSSRHW
ncbi:MAG: hypothetical protein JWQ49_4018 [Edaphobacter sp.]|jgi:hypothetical protein|nr:hypothetical protein [Edaphobacter sp.]